MTRRDSDDRARFRILPDPVRPDDSVEMVDTTSLPLQAAEERDRMLREAGGGG